MPVFAVNLSLSNGKPRLHYRSKVAVGLYSPPVSGPNKDWPGEFTENRRNADLFKNRYLPKMNSISSWCFRSCGGNYVVQKSLVNLFTLCLPMYTATSVNGR